MECLETATGRAVSAQTLFAEQVLTRFANFPGNFAVLLNYSNPFRCFSSNVSVCYIYLSCVLTGSFVRQGLRFCGA